MLTIYSKLVNNYLGFTSKRNMQTKYIILLDNIWSNWTYIASICPSIIAWKFIAPMGHESHTHTAGEKYVRDRE